MKLTGRFTQTCSAAALAVATAGPVLAGTETNTPLAMASQNGSAGPPPSWNWHIQSTAIVQGYPGFSAPYSGPNSLPAGGQTRETLSVDVLFGVRLWPGAEAHIDGLMWQGYGIGNTLGLEGFPNGEAFRLGTGVPDGTVARLFMRQTIGLGGATGSVEDGPLTLAGQRDDSRLVFTLGRFSAKDIFDNNSYANDPRTQFMNWAFMGNQAWDYPSDALGFITGFAAEWNLPAWTFRYGFFQEPDMSNGMVTDMNLLDAWGMVSEIEHRHQLGGHSGAVRVLAYLNSAHMGDYQLALNQPIRPPDFSSSREYRKKFGFGLNFEQEIAKNLGVFSRLGWSDGRTETWDFADVDRTASLGLSLKGECWGRPADTVGLAGAINAITTVHEQFFAAGGTGILAGDGKLSYGLEKLLETYYDCQIWNTLHAALDYQFIADPAYNRDRGPVSVFGARLHWEF